MPPEIAPTNPDQPHQPKTDYAGLQDRLFRELRGPKFGIPFIQLVMDYQKGDLAEGEVKQALAEYLPPEWQMNFTTVRSFKTTQAGFVAGQYGLKPRHPDGPALIIYINSAPRKDIRHARANNEGEPLLYGVLTTGAKVVGVNSKYSMSALRENFTSLHKVLVDPGGSQFRSRDNFPPFVCAVAHGLDLTPYLGEKLDPLKVIPEFKEGYIGYIDSFGNIKTTYRASSERLKNLQPGEEVEVDINGTEFVAHVATGSFSVPEGSFAFAPGSSGWDNRFWEVFQRGGNAAQSFQHPQVGAEVKLKFRPRN